MSVEIEPAELGFHRPFTVEVSESLKIRNPNSTPVAFKVKTTAPKQYCVRPNSGRIEPGQEVEVTVLLQAMKTSPPPDAKCRDKFLVQSVAVTPDKEFNNAAAIWQNAEAEKHTVQERKIRVAFLPEIGGGANTPQRNGVNGTSHSDTPESGLPPSYRSPSPEEAFTPQRGSVAPTGPISKLESEPAGANSLGDAKASAGNPATSGSASTGAAVSNAIPTSVEELKAQLAQAQATIASYSQEGGLRMRKSAGAAAEDAQATVETIKQNAPEGVPLQIVAGLCLLSFLMAYLFF